MNFLRTVLKLDERDTYDQTMADQGRIVEKTGLLGMGRTYRFSPQMRAELVQRAAAVDPREEMPIREYYPRFGGQRSARPTRTSPAVEQS